MEEEKLRLLNEIEISKFVYRKFMNSDEIKLCNQMVKEGLLYKSKPDEKNATIAFFLNR